MGGLGWRQGRWVAGWARDGGWAGGPAGGGRSGGGSRRGRGSPQATSTSKGGCSAATSCPQVCATCAAPATARSGQGRGERGGRRGAGGRCSTGQEGPPGCRAAVQWRGGGNPAPAALPTIALAVLAQQRQVAWQVCQHHIRAQLGQRYACGGGRQGRKGRAGQGPPAARRPPPALRALQTARRQRARAGWGLDSHAGAGRAPTRPQPALRSRHRLPLYRCWCFSRYLAITMLLSHTAGATRSGASVCTQRAPAPAPAPPDPPGSARLTGRRKALGAELGLVDGEPGLSAAAAAVQLHLVQVRALEALLVGPARGEGEGEGAGGEGRVGGGRAVRAGLGAGAR